VRGKQRVVQSGVFGFSRPFVTGGAGFIGSHLTTRFLARDDVERVVVFDNFTSGTLDHLAGVASDPRLTIVNADIKHVGEVTAAMRGCDAVFALAANPDIAKAVRQPDIDFWEGTYLINNVLEAMRLNGVKNVFYTSGSGVYGENPDVAFPENYGPCLPISTYGASKLACEALICSYAHMFEWTARACRFANVVGPRQTHGVGYDFVRRLQRDPSQLRILGDGTQCKSYIHVDDVLDAVFRIVEGADRSVPFDVFNVSTDDYITVTEIAEIALSVLSLARDSVRFDYTGGNRGWKGDVPKVRFDVTKVKGIGWNARRTSVDAIRDSLRAMTAELAAVSA
jgi:UDP-glucose 4-epimerase